jgi:hypothetical protein
MTRGLRRLTRLAAALLGVGLGLGPGALHAEAAGPWRGQVVDAETGQPLEGVVILAVWERISPGLIHARREFHDVDELVTDAQGRFAVPARRRGFANPLVSLDGPQFTMFKAGYGPWRERNLAPWIKTKDDVWKQMEKDGVVFELPQLRTTTERHNALPVRPTHVPDARMRRLTEEINKERVHLGLPPFTME